MKERQEERLSLLPTIGERFGEWFESPHYGKEGLGWLRKKRIQKKRLRLSTRLFASFFAPARLCRLLPKGRKKESKE